MRTRLALAALFFTLFGCSARPNLAAGPRQHEPTSTSVVSPGGTEVGPGSDLHPNDADSAWFVSDDRAIVYCLRVTPDFGSPAADLRVSIDEAFARWASYLEEKRIVFSAPTKLVTKTAFRQTCDGGEDLRFDFGVIDDEVVRHARRFAKPVAFPVRTSHEATAQGSWAKGFVWFAHTDYWRKPGALSAVIRHEVGHLLGVGHVPGTVMDENIAGLARHAPVSTLEGPTTNGGIDLFNELYRCVECAVEYSVTVPPPPEDASYEILNRPENQVYRALYPILKRPPIGPTTIVLKKNEGEPTHPEIHSLVIHDSSGKLVLSASALNAQVSYFPVGSPLFKIATADRTFRIESSDIEYRQTFYRNGKWEENPVRLTVRYLTHFFEPALRSPVQIRTDHLSNWKAPALFIPINLSFRFVEFGLTNGRTLPPAERKIYPRWLNWDR